MVKNTIRRILMTPLSNSQRKEKISSPKVKDVRKKELFHMLHTFVKRNLSLSSTLTMIGEEFSDIRELKKVEEQILNGSSVGDAFHRSGLIDEFVHTTLRIGEESGELEPSFETVHRYYRDRVKIKEEIRKLSIYPIIVCINMAVLIGFSVEAIFPQLAAMYYSSSVELPKILRFFEWWMRFRQDQASLLIGGGSLALFSMMMYFDRTDVRARLNRIKYGLPFVGRIQKSLFLKSFTWRMSVLAYADIKLKESLEIMVEVEENSYLKEVYGDLIVAVEEGSSFYQAVSLYPELFSQMELSYLRQGEESGAFRENLTALSLLHERDVERLTEKISSYGQPLILLFLGMMVAIVVFTVLPLLNVSELYF